MTTNAPTPEQNADLNARLDVVREQTTFDNRLSQANSAMVTTAQLDVASFLICRELLRGSIPDEDLTSASIALTCDPGRFGNPFSDLANDISSAISELAEAVRRHTDAQEAS